MSYWKYCSAEQWYIKCFHSVDLFWGIVPNIIMDVLLLSQSLSTGINDNHDIREKQINKLKAQIHMDQAQHKQKIVLSWKIMLSERNVEEEITFIFLVWAACRMFSGTSYKDKWQSHVTYSSSSWPYDMFVLDDVDLIWQLILQGILALLTLSSEKKVTNKMIKRWRMCSIWRDCTGKHGIFIFIFKQHILLLFRIMFSRIRE